MWTIIGIILIVLAICEAMSLDARENENEPPLVMTGQGTYRREWWA